MLAHLHPHTVTLSVPLRCSLALTAGYPVQCPAAGLTHNHCPPRAPLHAVGVAVRALRSRRRSAGVTPPSSLLRAHAPDRSAPVGFGLPYSFGSLQVVSSPCCPAALPDVISAILASAPGSRTPPRSGGAFVRFFPPVLGLTQGSRGSARGTIPQHSSMRGGLFRGCNHSLMFRLRCSLGPQTVPTFRFSFLPPLGRIHRAVFAPLPVTNSGIATCPNRTTDTIELAVALAPAHLLDRSLVGCS